MDAPHSRLTVRVRRDVLVDRTAFRLTTSMVGAPTPETVARIADEVTAALSLFDERGWIDDPETFHELPPAPTGLRERAARSGPLRYSSVTWPDGFEPRAEEPGAGRYLTYTENRIARVALMRHREDRPWLVCIHGWGMGTPRLDLRSFRALHLHRELGLNLAFVTLPFHGKRRPARSGFMAKVPGPDLMDNVHGLTQAVWDVRQLLVHLRSATDQPIGLMGLSLGSLVAGLVASIHDDLHAVITLVPAIDLPSLMAEGAERLRAKDEATPEGLSEATSRLLAPVSPLQLEPKVDRHRRFIVAGTLDQFASAKTQALALWEHWGEPELHWYHGGHVGLFWARGVQDAIDGALRRFELA